MKLNGWQRIGVVVSILWAVGAGIYERKSAVDNSYQFYSSSLEYCRSAANRAKELEELVKRDVLAGDEAWKNSYWDCNKRSLDTSHEMRAFNSNAVLSVLTVSLLPIALGWLVALLSIKVFRWIRSGFAAESAVPVAARTSAAASAPTNTAADGGKDHTAVASPEREIRLPDAQRHTPLWLALIVFAVGVVFVANRLMAKTAGVSPLAFLGDLPNVLPVLARHPDATVNYLAEATGMAVLVPLVHMGVASLFPGMRNKTSRRRIFIGWSVVGAIVATFL